jgi:peptide/nickel transport system permease protein
MAMRGIWPATVRCRLLRGLTARVAVAVAVLLICGLLAATLVRMAPGFGMDERMLDTRLSSGSLRAMERQGAEQSDILHYYWHYLRQLSHGDLGNSLSSGRPVRDLLSERLALSMGTAGAGLGLAWMLALGTVTILELSQRRIGEGVASLVAGALLCTPAALVALACVYIGATPAVAIAAIVFPRIFRYLRDVVRHAGAAPHVLTAHALGLAPWRILTCHVAPPVLPELVALGGISVSMAMGALIPVEALCDSPGVGQLLWQAAMARDLPVLVNVTLLLAACTIGANLLADTARSAREGHA